MEFVNAASDVCFDARRPMHDSRPRLSRRQQARLFAALEMLAQRKSVTEVAIAVGYDSVSAFIEMFRTMLGTTPQTYFRGRQEPGHE
jgi:methylphosphotriester-DNA--protein-cysteine methyltransferase